MTEKFDHLFIHSRDLQKSVEFYRDNLGFEVNSQWGDAHGSKGLQLARGQFIVVLADHPTIESQPDNAKMTTDISSPTVHVSVPNVDRRFAELAAGTLVRVLPENTHWGSRWFVVEDPDGNKLAFEGPTSMPLE